MLAMSVPSHSSAKETYQPSWDSLSTHQPAPEWFRNDKFGIYFHWGVYSVPAFGNEWYPARMYRPKDKIHKHHVEKYGDPAEYGYEKFVPGFTAEHFDADEWVDLFVKSGARFAGPVSEHHDGYSMWDSELTPWNSVDTGPKRDITGEMAQAVKRRGLKLITTFHHARNHLWQQKRDDKMVWEGHFKGAMTDFPKALDDPQRAFMYGYMPREQFLEMWFGKLKEVINNYNPDIIWFDSWLHEIPDPVKMKFLAYYFNHARQTGQEVLVTYKQKDLPLDVGVLDIEKGGMKETAELPWLSDDTISLGSWCYTEDLRIKETAVVLHSLVDIVSKNGQLVLNLSPKADGTIPQEQRSVLLELGDWLGKYGEAIYETRPFTIYGHGPTTAGKGHFGGIATDKAYTAKDVRYTRNGNQVYAIALGWPGAGKATLLTPFAESEGAAPFDISDVSLLGSDENIEWSLEPEGLKVTSPSSAPDEKAVVYKISVSAR